MGRRRGGGGDKRLDNPADARTLRAACKALNKDKDKENAAEKEPDKDEEARRSDLLQAAKEGDEDRLGHLLEQDGATHLVRITKDEQLRSALHLAAAANHLVMTTVASHFSMLHFLFFYRSALSAC